MASSTWIGQPVRRVEDDRLLKGQGRFFARSTQPMPQSAASIRAARWRRQAVLVRRGPYPRRAFAS
jgi:hypothetical protein